MDTTSPFSIPQPNPILATVFFKIDLGTCLFWGINFTHWITMITQLIEGLWFFCGELMIASFWFKLAPLHCFHLARRANHPTLSFVCFEVCLCASHGVCGRPNLRDRLVVSDCISTLIGRGLGGRPLGRQNLSIYNHLTYTQTHFLGTIDQWSIIYCVCVIWKIRFHSSLLFTILL